MVVCVIVWAPPGIPGKDGLGVGLESPCSQCCSRGSRVGVGGAHITTLKCVSGMKIILG